MSSCPSAMARSMRVRSLSSAEKPWPFACSPRQQRAFSYAQRVNPAQSLYDYLLQTKEGVRTNNRTVGTARELDDDNGMERQLRAVSDLLAVRRGIDELEADGLPVATYRKYISSWTNMVMSYPEGWSAPVSHVNAYPASILDHLNTLAGWFATRRPMPSDKSQAELRDFLDEVQDLLEDDDSISAELRVYLGRLIREMHDALDDEEVLERFDFDEAGRRLWTALFAASAQTTDDEKRSRWQDMAGKLWWPTAAGALGSVPSIIAGVLTATGH